MALQRIKESETFHEHLQAAGKIVLSRGTRLDYVTHYLNLETNALLCGHYFDTIEEAEEDFEMRVKRKW